MELFKGYQTVPNALRVTVLNFSLFFGGLNKEEEIRIIKMVGKVSSSNKERVISFLIENTNALFLWRVKTRNHHQTAKLVSKLVDGPRKLIYECLTRI